MSPADPTDEETRDGVGGSPSFGQSRELGEIDAVWHYADLVRGHAEALEVGSLVLGHSNQTMSPLQREAWNEAIKEALGPGGPPSIRVGRYDQCGSVERRPEGRGDRREVPVPMSVHQVGAARHRPADHRGRDDSESVWSVE